MCKFPPALWISMLLIPAGASASEPHELPRSSLDEIEFTSSVKRAFDRSGDFVTTKVEADGTISAELNGSFQNVTVARVGPGGEIETLCTTEEEEARNWMARQELSARDARPVAQVKDIKP